MPKRATYNVRDAETSHQKPKKSDLVILVRHLDGSEHRLVLSKKATGQELLDAFYRRYVTTARRLTWLSACR
jgi:hypothetical protein